VLQVAGHLALSGWVAKLRLQHRWPGAAELLAAFKCLRALPATAD
jgi:hypothetical protein